MRTYLDFEKPVAEIEAKVEELRAVAASGDVAVDEEIARLEAKAAQALKDLYDDLTPWQKTQVARHPERPHCLDYVNALITDFTPLAGDRKSTRLNSSHRTISYAVFCLKKKKRAVHLQTINNNRKQSILII